MTVCHIFSVIQSHITIYLGMLKAQTRHSKFLLHEINNNE